MKQSSWCLNQDLQEQLTKINLKRCNSELCIYTGNVNGQKVFLSVYVDDILITSKSEFEESIKEMKRKLQNIFEIKDLGKLHHFVRIIIFLETLFFYWNSSSTRKAYFWIGQDVYTQSILEKFNMSNCRPVHTPINPGTQIKESKEWR